MKMMSYKKEEEVQLAYYINSNYGVADELGLITNDGAETGNPNENYRVYNDYCITGGNGTFATYALASGLGFVEEKYLPYKLFYASGDSYVSFTSKWTPRKVNVRISDNDMTGFVGQELIIKLQESRALTDNQYLQSAVCIKGTQTSIKMEPDTDAINVQIRINPTGEYRFVKTYRYAGLFKTRVIEDKPRKIPVYQYELLVK